MEKIEIKDTDLTPNAIVLEDSEIIAKTCDIYKFKLSDEKKCDRLLSATGWISSTDFYFDPEWNDIDDFDFFLLRVKDNIITILEERKTEIIYKESDNDGSDDGYFCIKSLDDLIEDIDYYLENNCGKLVMSREGNRDNICIISCFDDYLSII
jgi:hypothetical protein